MTTRRVLIICDDQKLGKVIKHLLKHNGLQVELSDTNSLSYSSSTIWPEKTSFNLLIVAISFYKHDPLTWLASCPIIDQVRQVPWLVISDRPFADDLDRQIAHLYFPFDIAEFWFKVEELLEPHPSRLISE